MQRKHIISLIAYTVILIIVQLILVHNLRIFTYAMPILFLYPLFKAPTKSSPIFCVLFSFTAGTVMDMLMNTPGLNMASATLIGYLRTPILHRFTKEEDLIEESDTLKPSFATYPWLSYLLYLIIMVLIQATALFLLEAFSLNLFVQTIPYIVWSSLITLLTFLIFEAFSYRRKQI